MTRQVLFRNYHWLAAVAAIVGVSTVYFAMESDRTPIVGSVIAPCVGFCYFVQQQKLGEMALFKQLFTEFNQRYDALNDRLAVIKDKAPLDPSARQTIVDYLNLCAEEYLFFREGYIHRDAWSSWCSGMLW